MPNEELTDQIEAEESDGRQPDVISEYRPGDIIHHEQQEQTVLFTSEQGVTLYLRVHTSAIIQLQYVMEGDLRSDFSYAIDPDFQPEAPDFTVTELDDHFQITTEHLTCHIKKEGMLVDFYDADGTILCRDKAGFYRSDSIMEGIRKVKVTKTNTPDTHYYGLGDKACTLDLQGRTFENWNTDSYEYKRGEDPLYRSVPFYAALRDGQAYGIFLDNSFRTHFDFGKEDEDVTHFSAEGGTMNYYFIYGPELTTVSERYTKLTGTPELPPMWALGYHQCRWSYYPESRVRELAQTFRDKQIPCDAIYLDIDYMDGYRCFTWDDELFPDPTRMIEDLREQGFETIVMIDPGIKVDNDYFVYRQGKEKGFFCRRPDGDIALAPVWPAQSAFPDFTHPEVRHWWADLYEEHIANKKISGVWNDMNEPAVFEVNRRTFPDDIRHHYDGHPCSHKKAHNIYGMQMARASYEGIKQHNTDKRPFLLTRANFAGGQRYAALWTGDNVASWDHLRLANEQCLRLSISGYSFVGTDIGGFVDDPTPELFTRWLQLGIFHPLFRNHTMGFNVDGAAAVDEDKVEQKKKRTTTADQEPWAFGEQYTEINRSVIELRYRLLQYLYTAFHLHVSQGTPVLRPVSYYNQTDPKSIEQNDTFMFGDRILVSPVLEKGSTEVETYFPPGKWYDFRSNKPVEGGRSLAIDAPLAEIPFFVEAGTVLPLREIMQYTSERSPELLELIVYYSESASDSQLYEDDEEGYDYMDGNYRLTTFELHPDTSGPKLRLTARREGAFQPDYKEVKITVVGLPFSPSAIEVDEEPVVFSRSSDEKNPLYHFRTRRDFRLIEIA